MPVPDGHISSRWERTDQGFVLTVEAPETREGVVAVPLLGKKREIAMDGTVVWRHGRPVTGVDAELRADSVVFSGIQGHHTFAWGQE